MKSTLKVLHISKYGPRRGGMDQILARHAFTPEFFDHRVLALLAGDRTDPPLTGRADGLGVCINAPAAWLVAKAARRWRSNPPELTFYYNCWGADLLAGVDPARVRIGYLHNFFPGFTEYIRHYARYLDGFLVGSPPMETAVRELVPPTQDVLCGQVSYPVSDPFYSARGSEVRPCVIGFCARLIKAQKRVDRLPEFIRRLDAKKLAYFVEIVGDGPEEAWLREQLADHPRVRFLGWLPAKTVAERMRMWRYCISLSDYEGQSIALWESVASGCLPIYPDFHGGGDLPCDAAPWCLYPKGNISALCERVARLESADAKVIDMVKGALRIAADSHRTSAYVDQFDEFCRNISERKRLVKRVGVGTFRSLEPIFIYNRRFRDLVEERGVTGLQ